MRNYACHSAAILLWGVLSAMGQPMDDGEASAEAGALAQVVLDENVVKESQILIVPGSFGAISRSARGAVTLSAIDAETRAITLVREDGKTEIYTAGSGVANFDQLAVGDRVMVTYTESMAVYLSEAEVPESVFAAGVLREQGGAIPGGALLAQGQVTARVLEMDPATRQVKLELPSEEIRTIHVAEGIDLSQVKEGDSVAIAVAQSLEIDVKQP